jgi:hypothetical protein
MNNDDAKIKLAVYNKQYRMENRERLNTNKKAIYQLQKESISQKRMILIKCECGQIIGTLSLTKHKKSLKCRNRVANQFFS